MADRLWVFDNGAHRALFSKLLAPLVAAAGSFELRRWDDDAYARTQLHTWILMLGDVPEDVLKEAFERQVRAGITWMVRPGDVLAFCAAIVDERRTEAGRHAQRLQQDCATCEGTGWQTITTNGVESLTRCQCWKHGQELVRAAGVAIPRPALPAYDEA